MTPTERTELQTIGIHPVRKRPVQVLAVEITPQNYELIVDWINSVGGDAKVVQPDPAMVPTGPGVWVRTYEDWRYGAVGDIIICGTEKEFYPIKKVVYLNVYEDVVQYEED